MYALCSNLGNEYFASHRKGKRKGGEQNWIFYILTEPNNELTGKYTLLFSNFLGSSVR